jgi:Zn-dependent M16 (insulinase) family peptidase
MTITHGFELLREQSIDELNTKAMLYRHVKTGAELLSLINEDENKVFGISFRTPPNDSTGVAHILEHSVLCGSRKYPVKEPFVELLKSSLKTFLNAFTYPDKTCYPVASQNFQDFYNLVDVYLDAVFYPRLTPFVLQQEGWHFELGKPEEPLTYKGVVFNEMKGAYSSAERTLAEYSQQALFPDNTYGLESGGDPKRIPDLTYSQFEEFHRKYYHPTNARIFFCGDDDPERRLIILDEYLRDFSRLNVDSAVSLQTRFDQPKRVVRPYAAGENESEAPKGMVTVNWLLTETTDAETNMALHILNYILLGMPGSPLRKALIDSGLGEDIAGDGIESELRQMFFSTGLKGIDIANADRVEALIIDTLTKLAREGVDPLTVEAAVNTIEFILRENNPGNAPRGLVLMLRSLTTWLYGGDPLVLLSFEKLLASLKTAIASNKAYFQGMIECFFLNNPHRVTLVLEPDATLAEKEAAGERERLEKIKAEKSPDELQAVIESSRELKRRQEAPDAPEDLARIPSLQVDDLDRRNKIIPLEIMQPQESPILFHDIPTNGIAYLDVGFNMRALPQKYIPYIPLLGRAFIEMGTEKEDYVALTQRISRKTGGIRPKPLTSSVQGSDAGLAWLFLRGKAMQSRTRELLDILRDVLLTVRLDNRERFRQMVLEEKARQEQQLVPAGHQIVDVRIRSHFSEADWVAEQMGGVEYLFFLRRLARMIDEEWPTVLDSIEDIRRILIDRKAMLVNATMSAGDWAHFEPQLHDFLNALPSSQGVDAAAWSQETRPEFEGLTMPVQVNYVGKGADLYKLGYRFHGSALVITRYIRTSWLWDRVRVQGGAYGGFCSFNRLSGVLTFGSYRDPNLLKTIEAFDDTAKFLKNLELSPEDLAKNIIGAIGDLDTYMLPDAKGFISMVRYLTGDTDVDRQRLRDEIFGTTIADFKAFGELLREVNSKGIVKVLGSQSAIEDAAGGGLGKLNVIKVL